MSTQPGSPAASTIRREAPYFIAGLGVLGALLALVVFALGRVDQAPLASAAEYPIYEKVGYVSFAPAGRARCEQTGVEFTCAGTPAPFEGYGWVCFPLREDGQVEGTAPVRAVVCGPRSGTKSLHTDEVPGALDGIAG